MTWLLILANSLVFLVELFMAEYSLKHFFYLFGIVPARYTNMWTLRIFGDNVEDRIGPIRFLFFYLLCGLASGVVHCLANPQSTVPSVGASGAIAGVLGAYFALFPYARVIVLVPILFFPLFFERPALTYLGFWALIQVFSGTLSLAGPSDVGGVAWWAHVGGFAAGILLQFFFVRRRNAYRRPSCDEYEMESAWLPVRYWENDR
jgi:membrane associated rhomboid family serine protease